jgi:hypothetical protein
VLHQKNRMPVNFCSERPIQRQCSLDNRAAGIDGRVYFVYCASYEERVAAKSIAEGMARHAELTHNTGVKVYFCDPHSAWQRASCENINGLIRQYLPKGTDLSVHSQEQLDAIDDQLNSRRKC